MVDKAMRLPAPRTGDGDPFDAAVIPVASLLTAHEVGSALGIAVTARQPGPQPASTVQFYDSNGKLALHLAATEGGTEALMRTQRRGMPLPGIGDEAFARPGRAVSRCGDTVVIISLSGAGRRADPRNLHWLLATAVGRLTAAQPHR